MPSTPEPRRLLHLLLPVLALLGIGLGVIYWPRPQTLVAPPAMIVAEVAETPDAVLFGRVGHDLAWRLVAPREDPVAWRRFTEPARHAFLVTRFEEVLRLGDLEAIRLSAAGDEQAPQPAELAAAYTAIGAVRLAAACASLAAITPLTPDPAAAPTSDPYAAIRREFRVALHAEDSVKLCARYIRAHAADVLTPSGPTSPP